MGQDERKLLIVDPWVILFHKDFNTLSEGEDLKEAFSAGLQFAADLDISMCLEIFHDLIADGFAVAKGMGLHNSLDLFRTAIANASPQTDSVTQTAMSIVINDRYWSLKTLRNFPNPALYKAIEQAHKREFSLVFISLHPYLPAFQHLLRTRLPMIFGYLVITDSPIESTSNIDDFLVEIGSGKKTDYDVKMLIAHSDSEILRRTAIEKLSSQSDILIFANSSEEVANSMLSFLGFSRI